MALGIAVAIIDGGGYLAGPVVDSSLFFLPFFHDRLVLYGRQAPKFLFLKPQFDPGEASDL